MRTALLPSPTLLLYLFADKLAPAAPCKSARAEQIKLGQTLCAVAFWSLREQGVLSLQLCAARKLRAVTSIGVRVWLCSSHREVGASANCAPGLEAAIRDAVRAGQAGESVHAIMGAISKGEQNPHRLFLNRAALEATIMGLLPATHEHQFPSSLGCRCVADLEARADEVVARWRAFEQNEPLLHMALLKSCAGGFKSRCEATKPSLHPGAFSA